VTLNFSEARPYFFPANRSQVEKGNERRVTNVKGAERMSFSVRRAAFLLLFPAYRLSRSKQPVLEICTKSENLNLDQPRPFSRASRFHLCI
jgi:hypothetical protein